MTKREREMKSNYLRKKVRDRKRVEEKREELKLLSAFDNQAYFERLYREL